MPRKPKKTVKVTAPKHYRHKVIEKAINKAKEDKNQNHIPLRKRS